jgi:hypothetical protein
MKRRISATYDYTDGDGELLFQAVRYEPKGFSQRRPKVQTIAPSWPLRPGRNQGPIGEAIGPSTWN